MKDVARSRITVTARPSCRDLSVSLITMVSAVMQSPKFEGAGSERSICKCVRVHLDRCICALLQTEHSGCL